MAENKKQRSDKNRCKNSTSASSNIFKIQDCLGFWRERRGDKGRASLPNRSSGPLLTTGIPTMGVAAIPETLNPSAPRKHTHILGEKKRNTTQSVSETSNRV